MSDVDEFIQRLRDRQVGKDEAAAFFAGRPAADKARVVAAMQALADAPVAAGPTVEAAPIAGPPMTGIQTNQGCTPAQLAFVSQFVSRFAEKTRTSKKLAGRYRPGLADQRTPANFNILLKEVQYPLVLERAHGAHVQDIDGNSYVDIAGDFGVNLFGHAPRFLTEALKAQVDLGAPLCGRCPSIGEASALFCELTGHERVAFCQSGTEAVMSAVRLARAYTDRQQVAVFNNAYHGHADSFLNTYTAGVSEAAGGDILALDYGVDQALAEIEAKAGGLAAVLVEPVQSEHLDLQPVEFLRRLREITARHGVVLIFDEMITGFRAHPRGCQGLFAIQADLATYGKIVGGGMTAGVVAGRAAIMDWCDGGAWKYGDGSKPGPSTYIAGTHTQNPLKMAGTLAVLRELKARSPGLQDDLTRRTTELVTRLNAFMRSRRLPVEVISFASQFRFRFLSRRFTLTQALFLHLLNDAGVRYYLHGNCFLTAAHTDADIEFVHDAVCDSLETLRREGFFFDGKAGEAGEAETGRPTTRGRGAAPQPAATAAPAEAQPPQSVAAEPMAEPAAEDVARATAELKAVVGAYLELGEGDFDIDDDLADLGVDSIIMAGILKAASDRFGVKLSLKRLDGANTIAGVAYALCRAVANGDREADVEVEAENRPEAEAQAAAVADPAAEAPARLAAPAMARPVATPDEAVAIVGMSGVLPGAPDLKAFWANLMAGVQSVGEAPADRWDWRAVSGPDGEPGATRARWGGFIEGHDLFDPLFFRISPREAKYMDPQERLLLMHAHAALEDAGINPAATAGARAGVFVGYEFADYAERLRAIAASGAEVDGELAGLSARSYFLANRLSFAFDWKGPSEAINVNCASSAVAIHRARQSLLSGESDLAVAGGVSLNLTPANFIHAGDLLSPDGSSRVFGAGAQGFAKGEGCVVLALKRLGDAQAANDPIYAIVRGSGQAYRGRGASLSEVQSPALGAVIAAAHDAADAPADSVRYIEVDGYATVRGDAAEYEGVKLALAAAGPGKTCALGSLKPNVGNLEPVSGAAGVAKVALALATGAFPPTVGVGEVNPALDVAAEDHPLYLLTQPASAEQLRGGVGQPLRAGVNSFADSGVNVHILLEEAPAPAEPPPAATGEQVLLLSARTADGLAAYARAWAAFLAERPDVDLARAAFTTQVGREALTHRLACVGAGAAQLRAALDAFARGETSLDAFTASATGGAEPPPTAGNPRAAATFWAAGGELDWRAWRAAPGPGALHQLPTYPFALKRCWIDAPAVSTEPAMTPPAPAPLAATPITPAVVPAAAVETAPPLAAPPAAPVNRNPGPPAGGWDLISVARRLRRIVAAFLEIDADEEINEAANFSEIGLTSMSIVAFIDEVNRQFGVDLPEIAAFDFPNLEEMATHIDSLVGGRPVTAPPPRLAPPARDLDAILAEIASNTVSVDEALELLRTAPAAHGAPAQDLIA